MSKGTVGSRPLHEAYRASRCSAFRVRNKSVTGKRQVGLLETVHLPFTGLLLHGSTCCGLRWLPGTPWPPAERPALHAPADLPLLPTLPSQNQGLSESQNIPEPSPSLDHWRAPTHTRLPVLPLCLTAPWKTTTRVAGSTPWTLMVGTWQTLEAQRRGGHLPSGRSRATLPTPPTLQLRLGPCTS